MNLLQDYLPPPAALPFLTHYEHASTETWPAPTGPMESSLIGATIRQDGGSVNHAERKRELRVLSGGVLVRHWLYRASLKPLAELDASGNVVRQYAYDLEPTLIGRTVRTVIWRTRPGWQPRMRPRPFC